MSEQYFAIIKKEECFYIPIENAKNKVEAEDLAYNLLENLTYEELEAYKVTDLPEWYIDEMLTQEELENNQIEEKKAS